MIDTFRASLRNMPRPDASWQGPLGVLCVVIAVVWLTSPAWGLLALGVALLVAAAARTRDELVGDVDDDRGLVR